MGTVKQKQFIFLLFIIAITLVVAFFVLKDFLVLLALAAVFAVTFQPVMRFFLKFTEARAWGALFTTLVIIFCIIIPILSIGSQIFLETAGLYGHLQNDGYKEITTILKNLSSKLPLIPNIDFYGQTYIQKGLGFLVSNLGSLFGNLANIIAKLLIFFIILYYLLKDGEYLRKIAIDYSPLADNDDETVISKLEKAINSVMRGRVLIAFIQGILATTGMYIFGVPNPALWGSVTMIAALVPGIGTALVIIPASLYLFWQASFGNALGFLFWGILLVGLIDNVLGPKLLGQGIQIHPILILLSVLGGINFFGPLGFIIGPLTISLLFALIDTLSTINRLT
ncbi:MAG TPA: AI-2E family transporter [Candidatus Paceibacterota bacterium]